MFSGMCEIRGESEGPCPLPRSPLGRVLQVAEMCGAGYLLEGTEGSEEGPFVRFGVIRSPVSRFMLCDVDKPVQISDPLISQ